MFMQPKAPFMHWVWVTTPDGRRTALNLAAITQLIPGKLPDNRECTIAFFGTISPVQRSVVDARTNLPTIVHDVEYAKTAVMECPADILSAEPVAVPSGFRPALAAVGNKVVTKLPARKGSAPPALTRKDQE